MGAWAGCTLLAGLATGFLIGSIPDGIVAPAIAGTIGGLVAALATRRWILKGPEAAG